MSESEEEAVASREEETEADEASGPDEGEEDKCEESGMADGSEWDPQVRREQRHTMRQIIRDVQGQFENIVSCTYVNACPLLSRIPGGHDCSRRPR